MANVFSERDTELSGFRSFREGVPQPKRLGESSDQFALDQNGNVVSSDPEALAGLLQQLARRDSPISEEEIRRAASLLTEIIHSSHPAQMVAEHLEEIDALLPALIELNVRQASFDGQTDLAAALNELRLNIYLQKENINPQPSSGFAANGSMGPSISQLTGPRVLFLNSDIRETNLRMALAAEALESVGCQVEVALPGPLSLADRPEVVIVSSPHVSPDLMQKMAGYAAMNVPIICDLDEDYEEMPANHPAYERLGLGELKNARAYMASLMLARCVTVPSSTMASELSLARCPVWVVPDGWSQKNSLWLKPSPRRGNIHLGWIGNPGHVDDVALIRRLLTRIVREFQQTQLVIAGDSSVYHLFEGLPDARKLFLPFNTVEDYPYMLSQMDIVLAPLRNIPYNRAQSDRILVEAGVRQIPWVASPIPAFSAWAVGGILADSEEQWYTVLRQLVTSEETRLDLAKKGVEKAKLREANQVGYFWLNAIWECLGQQDRISSRPFLDE